MQAVVGYLVALFAVTRGASEFREGHIVGKHVKASEPPRGTIALLHGFPDTTDSFADISKEFSSRGFDTWLLSLPGYSGGELVSPSRLSVASVARQVCDFLAAADLHGVHVVGHDWGAAVALAISSSPCRDGRAASATALSVPPLHDALSTLFAHPMQLTRSWYMALLQVPFVAEAALSAFDFWLVRRFWRSWSPSLDDTAAEPAVSAAVDALRERAHLVNAITYYRVNVRAALYPTLPASSHADAAAAAEAHAVMTAPLALPTSVLVGEQDECISAAFAEAATAAAAHEAPLAFATVPGVGHFMHVERPVQVATAVVTGLDTVLPTAPTQ